MKILCKIGLHKWDRNCLGSIRTTLYPAKNEEYLKCNNCGFMKRVKLVRGKYKAY